MIKTSNPPLRLTPYAWAKLLHLRDLGSTEVGGFGISSAENLLLVEDVCLVTQHCTEVTVRFDDPAVADFFDAQVDAGLPPQRFARIWIHTHPGKSPHPSQTDEETFARCFGASDWAVMSSSAPNNPVSGGAVTWKARQPGRRAEGASIDPNQLGHLLLGPSRPERRAPFAWTFATREEGSLCQDLRDQRVGVPFAGTFAARE